MGCRLVFISIRSMNCHHYVRYFWLSCGRSALCWLLLYSLNSFKLTLVLIGSRVSEAVETCLKYQVHGFSLTDQAVWLGRQSTEQSHRRWAVGGAPPPCGPAGGRGSAGRGWPERLPAGASKARCCHCSFWLDKALKEGSPGGQAIRLSSRSVLPRVRTCTAHDQRAFPWDFAQDQLGHHVPHMLSSVASLRAGFLGINYSHSKADAFS